MNSTVRFTVTALALFFLILALGGVPWAALCLLGSVVQAFVNQRVIVTLASFTPAFVWLSFFSLTDNRQLFFPYAMFFTSYVGLLFANRHLLLGVLGGLLPMSIFVAVRILQQATPDVLGVEIAVALGVVTLAFAAHHGSPRTPPVCVLISLLASVVAYAGLGV